MSLLFKNPLRGCDPAGCGHYGASRGNRKHKGIDIHAIPGSICLSHIEGVVSKIGYVYAGDMYHKYVQLEAPNGLLFDFFYVEPLVSVGDKVEYGDELGVVQDVSKKHNAPDMKPHVHFQVRLEGRKINPEPYL